MTLEHTKSAVYLVEHGTLELEYKNLSNLQHSSILEHGTSQRMASKTWDIGATKLIAMPIG